jgi:hypothetical protein
VKIAVGFLSFVVVQRRLDTRNVTIVWIGLCRNIQPARTGTSYHVKFVTDIRTACAVDMNDVECRSRCRCVGKNFLKAAEGPVRVLAASANVHVDRSTVAGRNLEYFENL